MTDQDPAQSADAPTGKHGLVPPRELITGSFSKGADLLSYLISGLLIGLILDWAFGTAPIMLVVWTVLAAGLGYYRLWQSSEVLDEEGKARSHGA